MSRRDLTVEELHSKKLALYQTASTSNGSWFILVDSAELVTNPEPRFGLVMGFEGVIRSSDAHMLGTKFSPEVKDHLRDAKVKLKSELPANLIAADPEYAKKIKVDFDLMEDLRSTRFKELGWNGFEKRRREYVNKVKNSSSAKKRVAALMADKKMKEPDAKRQLLPDFEAEAKENFFEDFGTWHFAGKEGFEADPEEGATIRAGWREFDWVPDPVNKGGRKSLPKRRLDMDKATIFEPDRSFSDIDPDSVFPAIEEMRAQGYALSPIEYYEADGTLKTTMTDPGTGDTIPFPKVILPTGEEVYKWQHPWFKMLTDDSVVGIRFTFEFYDTDKGFGVRIKVPKSGKARRITMIKWNQTGSGGSGTTVKSTAGFADCRGEKRKRDDDEVELDDWQCDDCQFEHIPGRDDVCPTCARPRYGI